MERKSALFVPVFYDYSPVLFTERNLPAYVESMEARNRAYAERVLDVYRRGGTSRTFDDRSPAFGLAALHYSHTITDIANVWLYCWREANGDLGGVPFFPYPAAKPSPEKNRAMNTIRTALISVSDKRGVEDFALALHRRGVAILSTGGTARALQARGIPVREVADVTGFPELLDGRVKTLHPAIHAGILARRDRADDMAALAARGFLPIDLVVVNLYPFAERVAQGLGRRRGAGGNRHRRRDPDPRGGQEFPARGGGRPPRRLSRRPGGTGEPRRRA